MKASAFFWTLCPAFAASSLLSALYPAIEAALAAPCEKEAGPCSTSNDCCVGYTCKKTPGAGSKCVAEQKCVATGMLCHVQTAKCCGDFACTKVLGQVGICMQPVDIKPTIS